MNTKKAKILALQREIVDDLVNIVEGLPQNPAVKRVGAGAFTMRLSQTRGITEGGKAWEMWAPERLDFEAQYRELKAVLRALAPDDAARRVEQAANTGVLRVPQIGTAGAHELVLHPRVREWLSERGYGGE